MLRILKTLKLDPFWWFNEHFSTFNSKGMWLHFTCFVVYLFYYSCKNWTLCYAQAKNSVQHDIFCVLQMKSYKTYDEKFWACSHIRCYFCCILWSLRDKVFRGWNAATHQLLCWYNREQNGRLFFCGHQVPLCGSSTCVLVFCLGNLGLIPGWTF